MKVGKVQTSSAIDIEVQNSDASANCDFLDVWPRAIELMERGNQILSRDELSDFSDKIVLACNNSISSGRSLEVETLLFRCSRELRSQLEARSAILFRGALKTFSVLFFSGVAIATLWILLRRTQFWNNFDADMQEMANVLFELSGWYGFLIIGFSFGWLFGITSILRNINFESHKKIHSIISRRCIFITYYFIFVGLSIIVFLIFNGIDIFSNKIRMIVRDPPSGILIGVVLGFAEEAFGNRIRSAIG